MNLSEFAFRIIFIFIPGLITFNIISKLTFHKEFKTSDILLGSLTYGFVCYLIYYFIFILINNKLTFLNTQTFYFVESLTNSQAELNFNEIALVTLLAVPVGLTSAFLINHNLLFKLANKLKISDKLDDISLWNKVFDSPLNHWIVIRDIQNDLMYRGWVDSFSDGLGKNEILLRDVEVYRNSEQGILYSVPGLYISFNKEENLMIEFQSWEFTENMHNNIIENSLTQQKENHH
ncbi:hypothetical protein Nos7524_4723 [Nostoc sp. PCC 7524]|nr:hypothetical protein Nos7524_4723 [Nostoc sp. PCC 7524]